MVRVKQKELKKDLLKLLELKQKKLARKKLSQFILYLRPNYITSEFFYSVCDAIDGILDDMVHMAKSVIELEPSELEKKIKNKEIKIPQLILQAPPRHGKTDIVSRYLPAYFFGRFPHLRVLALSGGIELAHNNNRDVQGIMMSTKYIELFGNLLGINRVVTKELEPKRNMDTFDVYHNNKICGSYKCSSISGNFIGFGANLVIIDDPIKNPEMAHSVTMKNKLESTFNSTITSRTEVPFAVIIMHQRWSVDDLAGRLILKFPDEWKVMKFKAIQDDGTALIPKLVPLFKLKQMQKDPYYFSAMYQQEPYILGGNLIKTENFKYYDPLDPPRELVMASMSYIICDTAIGQKQSNDNTVMTYFRKGETNLYIPDLIKGKWTMLQQLEHMKNFRNKHNENVLKIERVGAHASNGLFELLAKENIPAIPINPKGKDKVARVRQATPYIDRGQVYLPINAPWLSDFLLECEQFSVDNSHAHDDQVDTLSYGIEEAFPIIQSDDAWNMIFNYKKL